MVTTLETKLQESIKMFKTTWDRTHMASTTTRWGKKHWFKYKTTDVIGRGSFGVVVKICDNKNRAFALKRVFQDKNYANRELSILLSIKHRYIININRYFYSNYCTEGKYLNIVTEFCPHNFETLIANKTQLGEENILRYYRQILVALEYLHEQDLAHRDIKPANILIDNCNNVKICDFGSAKKIVKGEPNVSYICSRFYRAPENLVGKTIYSTKIDIWAAGCTIAELFTFFPIFKGNSGNGTLWRIFEILKVSEMELAESGMEDSLPSDAPGIRKFLEVFIKNDTILDILEKSIVFSDSKRYSAKKLLKSFFSDLDVNFK